MYPLVSSNQYIPLVNSKVQGNLKFKAKTKILKVKKGHNYFILFTFFIITQLSLSKKSLKILGFKVTIIIKVIFYNYIATIRLSLGFISLIVISNDNGILEIYKILFLNDLKNLKNSCMFWLKFKTKLAYFTFYTHNKDS